MIGDVLTSTILFEAIKKKYPESELHYLINSHTHPVVEGNPFIDKYQFFTQYHEDSFKNVISYAKSLRHQNYDVVIDVYSKTTSNVITYFSKSKTRISKRKWYTSFLYTDTIVEEKEPRTNAGLAIENRLKLLSPLGIDTEALKPKIYLTEEEIEKGKSIIKAGGLDLNKPIFMIGVLGSSENKTYPLSYMAKIIDLIIDCNEDAQLLFNYIPMQINEAKAVYDHCKEKTQNQIFLDVFGKSLREFLMLTASCNALIGNEGGATNMAKALTVPTFTIFSPWINKDSWNMFDDNKRHVSVHLKDYHPEVYSNTKHHKELKKDAEKLYQKFKPELIKGELKEFIDLLH